MMWVTAPSNFCDSAVAISIWASAQSAVEVFEFSKDFITSSEKKQAIAEWRAQIRFGLNQCKSLFEPTPKISVGQVLVFITQG